MRVLLVEGDKQTAASIKMLLIKEKFICDTTDLGGNGLPTGQIRNVNQHLTRDPG
jgi:DNA-binding response OmpR family regulator